MLRRAVLPMTAVRPSADASCATVQRQPRPRSCRTIALPPTHRLVLGLNGHSTAVCLPTAMARIPAARPRVYSNGSFSFGRTAASAPLRPVEASEVQRQVSKWTSHSARPPKDSSRPEPTVAIRATDIGNVQATGRSPGSHPERPLSPSRYRWPRPEADSHRGGKIERPMGTCTPNPDGGGSNPSCSSSGHPRGSYTCDPGPSRISTEAHFCTGAVNDDPALR